METGICKIPLSLTFRSIQILPLPSFKHEEGGGKELEGGGRAEGGGGMEKGGGWKEKEGVRKEGGGKREEEGRRETEEEEGGEILRRRENTIWDGYDEESFQIRYEDRNISSRLTSMLYYSQRNNFLNEKIMKFNEKKNEESKKYDEPPSIEKQSKETYKTNLSIDLTLEKNEAFFRQSNKLVEMIFLNKVTEINQMLLGISFFFS